MSVNFLFFIDRRINELGYIVIVHLNRFVYSLAIIENCQRIWFFIKNQIIKINCKVFIQRQVSLPNKIAVHTRTL